MPRKRRPTTYTPAVLPQRPPRLAAKILSPPQRDDLADSYDEDAKPKKRRSGKIDDEMFAGIVRTAIDNCRQFDEDQLQGDRLTAWKMYMGSVEIQPANENGSEVISYDVRDMVHAVLPSIERIFFSSTSPVEFIAQRPQDDAFADMATRYINKIVRERLGVVGMRNVLMDTALSKVGLVMWRWEDATRVVTQEFTGLTDDDLELALSEEQDDVSIELVEDETREIPVDPEEMAAWKAMQMAGQQMQPPQPIVVHDCAIRYTRKTRQLMIEPVPPEERLMAPNATSADAAEYRGRRRIMKVYQLVALGYDRDELLEHANADVDMDPDFSQDVAARQPAGVNQIGDDIPDEDYRDVEYCELWIRCDRDGDGIAELLKICTIGNDYKIVNEESATQVQLAEFQMLPIPHSATGLALADNLSDIQFIKTALWRGVMESLPHSIYPRFSGIDGRVNWDDLLSNLPGQPIRVKDPQALQQFTVPFVGQSALDVMQFIDDNVREPRTGVSKAAQGLDPDALQSTSSTVASSVLGAVQSQLEDYARMLGASGFRQLYRGLLREVVANQRHPDWMKVNGQWQRIDPKPWNADMDVDIDVTGGTHGAAQKVPVLLQVAAAQKDAMQTLGPSNPLCNLRHLYNTWAKIVNLTGIGRVDQFWSDPNLMPDWKPTPPPEQQDPNAALAQAEVDKAKIADQTKRWQIQNENDRERDKIEVDAILKTIETVAKAGIPVDPLAVALQVLQFVRMPRPDTTGMAPPNPHDPVGQLPQFGAEGAGAGGPPQLTGPSGPQ